MKSIRRILSFLLAVVMVLGMVPPVTVRAEETTPPQETVAETIVTEPATEPAPETIPPETEAEPLPPETSAPVPEQTDQAEEETIAQEAADGDAAEVLTCVSEEITFSDAGLPDNDELFQAYADQVFYGNQVSLFGTAAGSRLTGDEKVLYDALVPILKQIAAGERSSTVISIGQDILSGGVTTAADVNATFTGETVTEESLGRLHNALLSDLPYELYWFRKQLGLRYWSTSTVLLVQLTFHAAGNYQGADSTCVDTAITGAAVKAAENARSIAGKYTDLSDYQKLIAYRDEICSLTSYDHAAASGGSSRVDNDPWQMIHVFDGDTSTNVVCEGYSKAFMYLCEQTDFQGQVDCYTVTGEMNSGGHMWNIVTLEGKNYLVDVTNSDTGTVGQNGGLFLAGGQGSASAGYWVYGVSFVYYGDELEQWGTGADSILTLSGENYVPGNTEGQCGDHLTWRYDASTATLTVSGSGAMYDYGSESYPWLKWADEIRHVVFEEGVTYIGAYSFEECSQVSTISLPQTLTGIGSFAFCGCMALETVTIPAGVTMADYGAFYSCRGLQEVYFLGSAPTGKQIFWGVTATVYYPQADDSWTETAMTNYGGIITWKGYCPDGGHTEVIDRAVAPTCTKTGLTEGKHCSVCGEIITAQTVIPAKGHTEVTDAAVEPDCTSTGLTEGKHCSVCNEVIVAQAVVDALGHTEVIDAAVAPTCTETGLTEGKHCSACGEVITAQEVIPAGHTVANGICTRCQAYGTCGENLTWTFDAASGTLTVSGTGEMENYSQNSAPWTPLGNDIKQIVVENGVTGIGDWAFYCCTYLEKAWLPSSIRRVGMTAFSGIIGDREYVIEQTVRQWSQIQEETQYFPNWETTSFVNEAPIVASGLYGEHVFWELDESGNMVFFGNGAMYDFGAVPTPWGALAVNSITIEEGITRIGHCAFEVSGTDVFSNTFEAITIPSSIASIGGLAFSNCKALKTITFMGDAPVFDPDSLNSFNGVTATAYYPAGNSTWTEAVMQNYGGTITWAPYCSNGHTEVIDEAVAPTCTEDGLTEGRHCAVCGEVIVAQEVISAEHVVENSICTRCGVYGTCGENLTWTLDENGVLTISGHGPMAEYNYNSTPWFTKRLSIQSIIVENGAESIIPLAFYYCENAKEITLPDSVKTIGMGAFRYCSSLETITLPAGLTVVESNLFSGCGSLKSISLPESITRLEESAFNGCGSLEEITIPSGVAHLDKWALSGCWNITKIIFTGDAPIIAEDAFTWISGTAYYPAGNPTWTKAFMKDYGGTITWASHQDGHIHTEVIDEAVSPSYTKSGLTEGKHCSDCNEVLVAQQTIPALGLLKPVVTVSGPDEITGIPTLTWEAVPEADAYGIYRATSKTGKYALVDTVAENIYEETSAAPGKTYYYKVMAICTADENLNSSYSAVVSAKVKVARPVITVETDEATGKPMISWEKVEGAKKYTVYRATSETGKYSSVKSTSGTSCTDTKAAVGTTYFYKVVAQPSSSSYKSADSEILSCLTIYAQPKVTVKLDAATGKPALSWAKVHKSVKYVVSYANSQEGPYTALEPQTALTWTDSDAAVDVDRFYMVQTVAADETLNSIPTEKNAHTIPAKPVVTAKSDPESGKPVITWNQVEGAAEYMISRATKSSGSYMVIQSTAETAFTDDTATVGKTYYYKVTALAANSASAASSYKSAKCVCAQPVIQVEADQVTGKPLISWKKVEGAKKYTVYRAASENGKYSSIKSTSGTSCTDTKATVGKTYFYKVVAQPSSSSYKSADSNILSCLTIYGQPKVTVKPDAVTGKPVLSWAKVHKSVKYVVSFADSLEGPYTSLEPQSTLTWTDVNAVVDTVRFYKVQTVAADETLNSFPAEVSACATPAKPVVTAKSDPASGKPMVSWTAVDGAIGYEVYRSTKSSSGFKLLGTVENTESYTDSTAAKGKTYYYKVNAVSRNASSAYSNAVKIKSK